MGESYFACAERETLEETGLRVRAEKLITLTNDVFSPTKHYITIFVLCRRLDETQEPQVRVVTFVVPRQHPAANVAQLMEPEKCESWEWKSWADVRAVIAGDQEQAKVFLPIVNLLRGHPNIEALIQSTRSDPRDLGCAQS